MKLFGAVVLDDNRKGAEDDGLRFAIHHDEPPKTDGKRGTVGGLTLVYLIDSETVPQAFEPQITGQTALARFVEWYRYATRNDARPEDLRDRWKRQGAAHQKTATENAAAYARAQKAGRAIRRAT